MPRTNKRQRVAKVAFPPSVHTQVTQPTPKPVPLPKWSRTKTLFKLADFRLKKLDKNEIAPLFQNLINYNVVHTLPQWEQNVAWALIRRGICKQ